MGLLSGNAAANAAGEYGNSMKKIAKGYGTLGKGQYRAISPYMNAGTQALSAQMEMLANPMNSQQALSDYYSGPQYDQQMQAANYAANSAAEASGGLGNSATGNALAAQSADMGQQYLQGLGKQRQQQFSNLGGLSKQGLSATNTMGNWANQDTDAAANLLSNAASAQARGEMAQSKGRESFLGGAMGMAAHGLGKAGMMMML